jgi:hypothetical protein
LRRGNLLLFVSLRDVKINILLFESRLDRSTMGNLKSALGRSTLDSGGLDRSWLASRLDFGTTRSHV